MQATSSQLAFCTLMVMLSSGCSQSNLAPQGTQSVPTARAVRPPARLIAAASPRPFPTPNLYLYPVKIASDGVIQIGLLSYSDDPTRGGPLHILSAALNKYPKAIKFKVDWIRTLVGSYRCKVLYDRKNRKLKYDDDGGLANPAQGRHWLFTRVTDKVIHKAASGSYGSPDAGFLSLSAFGCGGRRVEGSTAYNR